MSASSLLLTAFSQAALWPYKCPLVQSHTEGLEIKLPCHTLHNWPFACAPRGPINQRETLVHLYRISRVIDTGSAHDYYTRN